MTAPRLRYSHDAMVDLIVSNPAISQNQIAAAFGYTPAWVSIIVTSDAFQAKLAERREEIVDPAIRLTLEERFRALVTKSLDVLQEKLSAPISQVADNTALKAAELGAKALGLGLPQVVPSPEPAGDRLEALAERLVALQRGVRSRDVIDVEVVESGKEFA